MRGHGDGSGLVWPGSLRGLAVAACSCAYTLWDGYAIASLGASVLPYLAVTNVGQLLVLSLFLGPRKRLSRSVLTAWRQALPIAVLTSASYGLVLVAMSLSPVSTVAAGRTLNVAVGNLLGVFVLRERLTVATLAGLTAIVAGVLLVSIGADEQPRLPAHRRKLPGHLERVAPAPDRARVPGALPDASGLVLRLMGLLTRGRFDPKMLREVVA